MNTIDNFSNTFHLSTDNRESSEVSEVLSPTYIGGNEVFRDNYP